MAWRYGTNAAKAIPRTAMAAPSADAVWPKTAPGSFPTVPKNAGQ